MFFLCAYATHDYHFEIISFTGSIYLFYFHFSLFLLVTFELVRAECVRQRNEVVIKLGIISLSFSSPGFLL